MTTQGVCPFGHFRETDYEGMGRVMATHHGYIGKFRSYEATAAHGEMCLLIRLSKTGHGYEPKWPVKLKKYRVLTRR